ncbi:hypothetical protein EVAR_71314_1 [Eumeta japonica]|uniref:Uncharacterized protein n=1 Tax=Eumeta variegata TaxID=151549 RepID=A0A4C2A7X4_EUMVA|nr:hypothetical protein EVAR_71314_1 [Eumeta japonica]
MTSYTETIPLKNHPLSKLRAVGTLACYPVAFGEAVTASQPIAQPTRHFVRGYFSGFRPHTTRMQRCVGMHYAFLPPPHLEREKMHPLPLNYEARTEYITNKICPIHHYYPQRKNRTPKQ